MTNNDLRCAHCGGEHHPMDDCCQTKTPTSELIHYCPQCGEIYYCPCKHCDIEKKSKHVWFGGELVRCTSCGFTTSFDEMLDIELMQLEWQGFDWRKV